MQRCIRRRILALTLLLFPLVGCEPKQVWLELPAFGSGDVDGVWLWRLSESTAGYERTCRITLDDPKHVNGLEQLGYRQECVAEDAPVELAPRSSATRTIRKPSHWSSGMGAGRIRASTRCPRMAKKASRRCRKRRSAS